MDNVLIQGMFSQDDKATRYEKRNEEDLNDQEWTKLREVRYIINYLLPEIERSIIIYTFDYNKKQEDIGKILGISQEMVHYYKRRAIYRIHYIFWLRQIDIQHMKKTLKEVVTPKQLEAMMLYFQMHNQHSVASRLKINQSAVSSRINLGVERLKKLVREEKEKQGNIVERFGDKITIEGVCQYLLVFEKLLSNNSLYEVQTKKTRVHDPAQVIKN